MRRVVPLLIVLSLGFAPAPVWRPGRTWSAGWDNPVGRLERGHFHRKDEKLTISVAGKGFALESAGSWANAPRLLRDVEGDFTVEVRVGAVALPPGKQGSFSAGIFLPLGRGYVTLQRMAIRSDDEERSFFFIGMEYPTIADSCLFRFRASCPPDTQPAYLRLERRGNWLTLLVSADGRSWHRAKGPFSFQGFQMPRRLKVGVAAEATESTTFMAGFDQFKLTIPDVVRR